MDTQCLPSEPPGSQLAKPGKELAIVKHNDTTTAMVGL